jgi:hypothetical protein
MYDRRRIRKVLRSSLPTCAVITAVFGLSCATTRIAQAQGTPKPAVAASATATGNVASLRVHADVLISKGTIGDGATTEAAITVPYVPAMQGQGVRTGQGIRTLKRSFAELDFHDRSVLRVNERTDLVLQDAPTLRNIRLNAGAVWIKVAKGTHTQIETPSATAVARGTAFEVTQEADEAGLGAMKLAVVEGQVDLMVGGTVVKTLGPGESIRVGSNGVPNEIQKMDPSEMTPEFGGNGDPWWQQIAQQVGGGGADTVTRAAARANKVVQNAATKVAARAGGRRRGSLLGKAVSNIGKAAVSVVAGQASARLGILKNTADLAAKLAPTGATLVKAGTGGVANALARKALNTAITKAETAVNNIGTERSDPPARPQAVSTGDITAPAAQLARQTETIAAAAVSPEGYTGVLIDTRHLAGFQRSPAPVVYGPNPDSPTVYPDVKHVPTPDEVQDQSVIRYYRDEESARQGFVGAKPLIIKAVEAVGPGKDCVRVSAEDMALLKELDQHIRFTRTWKVGVLLPSGK